MDQYKSRLLYFACVQGLQRREWEEYIVNAVELVALTIDTDLSQSGRVRTDATMRVKLRIATDRPRSAFEGTRVPASVEANNLSNSVC